MTKFCILTALPSAVAVLAAFLAASGIADFAAAQSAKGESKALASSQQESRKDPAAMVAVDAPEGQASDTAAPAAGLKVVKDPETGKLRGPDRAEAAKLGGQAANRSAEGLQSERLPNGATVINLQGRFQSYSVARRNANGAIEFECTTTKPEHDHSAHSGGAHAAGTAEANTTDDKAVNSNGK